MFDVQKFIDSASPDAHLENAANHKNVEALVKSNVKIATQRASRAYKTEYSKTLSFDEIFAAALEGLVYAAVKWDPSRAKFSTFAYQTIDYNISKAYLEAKGIKPSVYHGLYKQYLAERSRIAKQKVEEPQKTSGLSSVTEISENLDVSPRKIEKMLLHVKDNKSLDDTVQYGDTEVSVGEIIPDESTNVENDVLEKIADERQRELLYKIIASFPEAYRTVGYQKIVAGAKTIDLEREGLFGMSKSRITEYHSKTKLLTASVFKKILLEQEGIRLPVTNEERHARGKDVYKTCLERFKILDKAVKDGKVDPKVLETGSYKFLDSLGLREYDATTRPLHFQGVARKYDHVNTGRIKV